MIKIEDLIKEVLDEYYTHRADRFKDKGEVKDKLAQRRVTQGVKLIGSVDNHDKASVYIVPDLRLIESIKITAKSHGNTKYLNITFKIRGATIKPDRIDDLINEDFFDLHFTATLEGNNDYSGLKITSLADKLTPEDRKTANIIARFVRDGIEGKTFEIEDRRVKITDVEVHPNALIAKNY